MNAVIVDTSAILAIFDEAYREYGQLAKIMTLGQRHFRALRPLWGADYFTILPYGA